MKRSSKQSKSHKQNWITFPAGIWPRHTWTRSPTAQWEFGYKWNTAIASSSSRVVVNHFNPAISLLLRLAGWSGTLTELRSSLFRPLPCRSRLTEWPTKVLVTSPLNSFNSTPDNSLDSSEWCSRVMVISPSNHFVQYRFAQGFPAGLVQFSVH